MGLRAYYADPRAVVWKALKRPEERNRRANAQIRVDIYSDKYEQILKDVIAHIFQAPEIRFLVQQFAPFACANSLLKRIVNDICRAPYSRPPVRIFTPTSAGERFDDIAEETNINRVLDLSTKLVEALNDLILMVRFVKADAADADADGQMCIDILTPAVVTVIPHPDMPTKALAIAYARTVDTLYGPMEHHVVWDDREYFEIDQNGFQVTTTTAHDFGRIPMVEIHRTPRYRSYWDEDGGADRVAASLQVAFLNCLILKLHYMQGEKIIAVTGEAPHDQTIDGGNILQFPDATHIVPLDLVTPAKHYLETKAEIETTIAANYGISRARLNQTSAGEDDQALYERTAELVQVMGRAESDLLDVLKRVSREDPEGPIPATATMVVDYGEFATRADRKKQLEIRLIERKMGVRSILDDMFEDNPELKGDSDAAWKQIQRNMDAEAEYIKRRRALNISEEANAQSPGQTPQQNGRMGPLVASGQMSRNDAALLAENGAPTNNDVAG